MISTSSIVYRGNGFQRRVCAGIVPIKAKLMRICVAVCGCSVAITRTEFVFVVLALQCHVVMLDSMFLLLTLYEYLFVKHAKYNLYSLCIAYLCGNRIHTTQTWLSEYRYIYPNLNITGQCWDDYSTLLASRKFFIYQTASYIAAWMKSCKAAIQGLINSWET